MLSPNLYHIASGLLLTFQAAHGQQTSSVPRVSIPHGTLIGSRVNGIDTFLGIPYAQPPTGDRRLRPPQAITSSYGTLNATSRPLACPELPMIFDPKIISQLPQEVADSVRYYNAPPNPMGEDCLTLNIQRPSTATGKLPVVVWMYGGAFERGSTQGYDFAYLVNESLALNKPVIVVQMNYRLSAFGFLGGKQLQKEGSTNLGLRDQRLALQWVADNIAAFGGDADKVTLWGQSAGSFSVFNHLIINGGDHTYKKKPLFRAAIMESASTMASDPVDSKPAQQLYDNILKASGCTGEDSLKCLRSLPYEDFLNATAVVPSFLNTNGTAVSFVPRPDPKNNFLPVSPHLVLEKQNPSIARVPLIAGHQDDEGTLFAFGLYNATSAPLLTSKLLSTFPSSRRSALDTLIASYPSDPSAGSPFNTGSANEYYQGFKRNAAVFGDILITFPTRQMLETISKRSLMPAWGYQAVYNKQVPVFGTNHGSELALYALRTPEVAFKEIMRYYVGFVNELDPNALVGGKDNKKGVVWPQFGRESRLVQFADEGARVVVDDARAKAYRSFLAVRDLIRF